MSERGPAGGGGEAPGRSVDRDGVVTIELGSGGRRRLWPLALAVPAIAGLAFLVFTGKRAPPPPRAAAPPAETAREPEAPVARRPALPRAPAANAEAAEADEGPEGGGEEGAGGEPKPREGIYAFPPPGTKRIKEGIVVPEGFALPPGYMRHYQATDKGEMLQAILMFHPDYHPVDAGGRPVILPEDRVVPPEMAPPGLAVETLVVPEDAYADPERERAESGL